MPSLYGRGPYGQGNYSAATTYATVWAAGSFHITGIAVGTQIRIRTLWAAGAFAVTANAVATGVQIKTSFETGAFDVIANDVDFAFSTVWTPETDGSDSWLPAGSTTTTWTPVTAQPPPWVAL